MFRLPKIKGMFLFPLLLATVIFYCALPDDPTDPTNTKIAAIFKASDTGTVHSGNIIDTVNKKIFIGAQIRLPENIDSIMVEIKYKESLIYDTVLKNIDTAKSYMDTVWINRTFADAGVYYVVFTPFSSLNINSVSANIVIVAADNVVKNKKPLISISGNKVFNPAEICTLTVAATDTDANQQLTLAVKGNPDGSLLNNGQFIWTIPAAFSGMDTVLFIASDNGQPQESDTETVVIVVSLTPKYHITYDANTGSGSVPADTLQYVNGSEVIIMDAPSLAKAGFTFAGWNTLADGTGAGYMVGTKLVMGSAGVVLYAQWTNNPTYTVTYDANTGTGTVPADVNQYEAGAIVTTVSVDALVKSGCTFTGWNTVADGSGTAYTQNSKFQIGAANVILYAQWTANPTYTVTYDVNTGTGTVPADVNKYEAGATVTAASAGALVKDGYTFTGWNTAADGSQTAYAENAKFQIGAANVILYAQWAVAYYTVTYDANGGMGTVPVDTESYLNGENVTIQVNSGKLQMAKASFTGWNTAADGSGNTYSCGQVIKMEKQNLVLYAKYSEISVMDNDGNIYKTVKIGNLVWLEENLKTTKYNDGTPIPLVAGKDDWSILATPGYCWYENDENNRNVYGALYNWYAVNTHKLAPAGWHVSTESDWIVLENICSDSASLKIRKKSPLWSPLDISDSSILNSTGFSALPGGYRDLLGTFQYATSMSFWWNSEQCDDASAQCRMILFMATDLSLPCYEKIRGLSVRCVRDN